MRRFAPEAIVSTGFCGALDETLGIADVVAATAVVGERPRRIRCAVQSEAPHIGVVCSIDHVAQTAEEKRRLRRIGGERGGDGSGGSRASRAQYADVPFYCVRAVTDLAGESMANDFNRALRSDGHFDTMKYFTGSFASSDRSVPGTDPAA